jgi:hypothetical protein
MYIDEGTNKLLKIKIKNVTLFVSKLNESKQSFLLPSYKELSLSIEWYSSTFKASLNSNKKKLY